MTMSNVDVNINNEDGYQAVFHTVDGKIFYATVRQEDDLAWYIDYPFQLMPADKQVVVMPLFPAYGESIKLLKQFVIFGERLTVSANDIFQKARNAYIEARSGITTDTAGGGVRWHERSQVRKS